MPTQKELRSIVDYGRPDLSINTYYFPNTVASYYWSFATYFPENWYAWTMDFSRGLNGLNYKSDGLYVRAVRGEQAVASFVNNGDGTITDTSTGLMWQQTTAPGTYTWAQGLSYCENLSLAGYSDWRLPNPKEMDSIVDYRRYRPSINVGFFPDTIGDSFYLPNYWLSTTVASNNGAAWSLDFYYGGCNDWSYEGGGGGSKLDSGYVRTVRGGQSIIPGHLLILSPAQASTWKNGTTMPIIWETRSLGGNVSISLSRDGGGTFETIIDSTPNDGSFACMVTGPDSVNCALKITPLEDVSKENIQLLFSIQDTFVADNCPEDPNKTEPGICGCGIPDADTDTDGTPDCYDNCPNDSSDDIDGDSVCGYVDNCPNDSNFDQTDADSDGLGDACDSTPNGSDDDSDGDGLPDGSDNCPDVYNPDQSDADSDGLGDACDMCPNDTSNDADGDGVCGYVDNCPNDSNFDQTDADTDGIGDACDSSPNGSGSDMDGDGVLDEQDNCDNDPNKTEPGICGCGITDMDTDSDGKADCVDNCPNDSIDDIDGDGVCGNDNCPSDSNFDQADADSDGMGDACDSFLNGDCIMPPDGLISWWPGDGDALDIVGGNNGELLNGAGFAPGIVGQAFSFDGIDDIVVCQALGLPEGNSSRTVAFWVKVDPEGEYEAAFGYGGGSNGTGFYINPVYYEGLLMFSGHGGPFDLYTSEDLRDNQYYHVAVTYNSNGTTIIYVDGEPVATRTINLNTGLSEGVGIGGRVPMFSFFHGIIDEVAVWNRDLTKSEIQGMFNAGSAGMCKPANNQAANAGPDQVVELAGCDGSEVTLDGSMSTDPDNNIVTYEWLEGDTVLGEGQQLNHVFPLGVHTVTLKVTDALGMTDTDEVVITVQDTSAPGIVPPENVEVECEGLETDVNIGNATAVDACLESLACDEPNRYSVGSTTITWTAVDSSGNTSTATQTVTVVDTTAPAITPPADITVECSGVGGQAVDIGTATATDACCGDIAITNDAPATFAVGQTVVTWTATDCHGNAATATQTVTVADTTPPELAVPEDITTECSGGAGTPVDIGSASASDACCGELQPENDAPELFPMGTTVVTWTATDCNGNTATATQTITVHDTTAPAVQATVSQNSLWPANNKMVDVGFDYQASDGCSGNPDISIAVTSDEPTATAPGAGGPNHAPDAEIKADGRILLRAERSGSGDGRVYRITATATDASGNSASSSVHVRVNHNKKTEAVDSGQLYDATQVN